MTIQHTDRVVLRGKIYSLVGQSGGGLIYPAHFGMKGVMVTTANRRGFTASYAFVEGSMFLDEFALSEQSGNYPAINNVAAVVSDDYGVYSGLNLPVQFTGNLRLATDFDRQLFRQRVSAATRGHGEGFRTMIDVTLKNGVIVAESALLGGNTFE